MVLQLLEKDYNKKTVNLIMIKGLLNVFLKMLMHLKEQHFTGQNINEKRVYEFILFLRIIMRKTVLLIFMPNNWA